MFTSHFYYANYACKQSRSIIKILDFVHLWSKEVPVNISYPSTINNIDEYLDARISPTPVGYIISRYKKLDNKKNKTNRSQGCDIQRLLLKKP